MALVLRGPPLLPFPPCDLFCRPAVVPLARYEPEELVDAGEAAVAKSEKNRLAGGRSGCCCMENRAFGWAMQLGCQICRRDGPAEEEERELPEGASSSERIMVEKK